MQEVKIRDRREMIPRTSSTDRLGGSGADVEREGEKEASVESKAKSRIE